MPDGVYLLDSNVFISSKNAYYSFDICPGFWKSLVYTSQVGHIFSIDKVYSELLAGHIQEDLVRWVENKVPKNFFLSTNTDEMIVAYKEVMSWLRKSSQYYSDAVEQFALGADAWLVACGMVNTSVIVTNEDSRPNSKRSVKLPDACNQFDVRWENLFSMLQTLNIQFDWIEPDE